eukprot:jgi/Mesvir1/5391/Mv15466-RA.1
MAHMVVTTQLASKVTSVCSHGAGVGVANATGRRSHAVRPRAGYGTVGTRATSRKPGLPARRRYLSAVPLATRPGEAKGGRRPLPARASASPLPLAATSLNAVSHSPVLPAAVLVAGLTFLLTRDATTRGVDAADARAGLARPLLAEMAGTAYLTFGVAVVAEAARAFAGGAVVRTLVVALGHLLLVPLLVYATGPVSGGHLNPMVTLAAVFRGLITLPRGLFYIAAQTVGGVLGAAAIYLLTGVTGLGVVSVAAVPTGVALLAETLFSFFMLAGIDVVAADPTKGKTFGPVLAPIMVGLVVALTVFLSGAFLPGYPGAAANPARAFGPSFLAGGAAMRNHWVQWLGPLLAAQMLALAYRL